MCPEPFSDFDCQHQSSDSTTNSNGVGLRLLITIPNYVQYRQPHGPRLKGGVESHGDAVEDVHHQEGGRLHPGHLHHQAWWRCWSIRRQIQCCLLTKRFRLWIIFNLLVKNGPDENADADKIGEAVPGKRCTIIAHFLSHKSRVPAPNPPYTIRGCS